MSYTYTYIYDADGMCTRRTNGSTTLDFRYDASGTPMTVTYGGTTYYYATNLQGDVVAILDGSGTAVVSYTYDAWGNILSTTGSLASTLGIHNPLRYRGYVYDTETELYYLQSRYYDPSLGRFINADVYVSTGQGMLGNNMFAYCLNNPVNYSDSSGHMPQLTGDPIGDAFREFGKWLYDWLYDKTEEDKAKIKDGTVSYSSKGTKAGAKISNSYEVDTPWVMYQYIAENRGDEITGTTTGVVVEWLFHNLAYAAGNAFNLGSIKDSAKSVDVGETIFSDYREGFNITAGMSLGMKIIYALFSPITAAYDLGMETGRWDHVYPRE